MARSARQRSVNQRGTADQVQDSRIAAMKQMNPVLRGKFSDIEKDLTALHDDNLRKYYGIGKIGLEIKEDKEKRFGKNAYDLVCDALSVNRRLFRTCVSFAGGFAQDELKNLIDLTNERTGFKLHFGHVRFLLIVKGRPESMQDRSNYMLRAVEGQWEPNKLHEEIKAKYGDPTGGHGPSHRLPPTISAQIRQIRDISKTWIDKNNSVWAGDEVSVLSNIETASSEQFCEADLKTLREVRDLMQQIAACAESNVSRLDSGIEYVEHCLAAQSAAKREAEAEKAAREARSESREQRVVDVGREPEIQPRRSAQERAQEALAAARRSQIPVPA